jgi:hypothetical protein
MSVFIFAFPNIYLSGLIILLFLMSICFDKLIVKFKYDESNLLCSENFYFDQIIYINVMCYKKTVIDLNFYNLKNFTMI